MNFIGYVILVIGVLWFANNVKQFFVKKALESLDEKGAVLKQEEQVFQKKIDVEQAKLKAIEAEEAGKSKEQIIDFWDKQDAKDDGESK